MANRGKSKARLGEQGWALVSVLWAVVILTVLAMSVQSLVGTAARTEARLVERARMEATLGAAVSRAVLGITDRRLSARWHVDGTRERFRYNGYDVAVSVQDEAGKIDINASDVSVLSRLLASLGADNAAATQIADNIVDWRSAPDLKSLHSSDRESDVKSDLPQARHGPFKTIDELQLVPGITPSLFERIRPAITVYTARPVFDELLAPAAVKRAFSTGGESSKDTDDFSGKLDTALPAAGHSFTIFARIKTGKTMLTREAVVMLTGDERHPYIVRSWR